MGGRLPGREATPSRAVSIQMNPIVLITDFGTGSPYVAEMKGAMLKQRAQLLIVDGTHDIPPQDVNQGAFVLRQLAAAFPAQSVFVVVVDPGVGTSREILLVEHQQQYFIGPDNGVLTFVFDEAAVLAVDVERHFSDSISTTFHGRDVMGPLAARLSCDSSTFRRLTRPPVNTPVQLRLPQPQVQGSAIVGELVYVDRFGNLISNISRADLLFERTPSVQFRDVVMPVVRTYSDVPAGTPIALVGSGNWLEIAVTNGNARDHFDAHVGDDLQVLHGRATNSN